MAKNRDRRTSHRSEWSDEAPRDFQEPSFFRQPPTPTGANGGVKVVVLWFNPEKGFGFVRTPDGGKAFLHARQLEAAGHTAVTEGMEMTVVVETGERGRKSPEFWRSVRHRSPIAHRLPRRHEPKRHHRRLGERSSSTTLTKALALLAWPMVARTFLFMHPRCRVRASHCSKRDRLFG